MGASRRGPRPQAVTNPGAEELSKSSAVLLLPKSFSRGTFSFRLAGQRICRESIAAQQALVERGTGWCGQTRTKANAQILPGSLKDNECHG